MKRIEKAEVVDLPQILDLQKKAFGQVAKLMNKYDLPPLLQSLEELRSEYQHSIILKYLLENNRIIGSVRGCIDSNNMCHIGKLVVDPDYQGQSIGKVLMREIETYFPSCEKFVLFTGVETPNTVHLYKKIGYTITENQSMGGISMFFMEKINDASNT